MIGEVFGSYRVVSELGSGGMGTVFLAEHQMLGSRAAIKVLRPELSQQQHVVQRFFDEARAATRVADPGIVTVLDFGWHPSGRAYLVMEHLTGETLTQRIKRQGYLPPGQALAVVRQCAMAMGAAHGRGIVHRDLKPDNIFIVPDPAVASERIKVLDFGIAKLLGDGDASHGGTQTGMILGTPGYMSPEQCRGAGKVDHRTDIYALGCVLFHMLCGRPPFDAPTPGDLIAAHLIKEPPVPSTLVAGISAGLDDLIAGCLAKDAAQRIQTMTELVEAIDTLAVRGSIPPRALGLAFGTDVAAATSAIGTGAALPVAATPTTLGSGVGQSIEGPTEGPHRSWRGGVIALGVTVAVAAVVVIALTMGRARQSKSAGAPPAGVDASIAAHVEDAAPAPTPDAAIKQAATPPDAAPRRDDRPDPDRGSRSTTRAGSTTTKAGSGSTTKVGSTTTKAGSGSATTKAGSGSTTTTTGGSTKSGSGAKAGSGSAYDPYDVR